MTLVGIGVDAVDVDRFRRLLRRRPGVARRVFTAGERAEAARGSDPAPRLAARFAAKEATLKALGRGLGGFPMSDVEVVGTGSGAPVLRLGAAAAAVARRQEVGRWHLSLTHTEGVAVALVVAEADPGTHR